MPSQPAYGPSYYERDERNKKGRRKKWKDYTLGRGLNISLTRSSDSRGVDTKMSFPLKMIVESGTITKPINRKQRISQTHQPPPPA